MILLPTRRRLERRRDALYKTLHQVIHRASVHDVEELMRQIHGINIKLKTYFISEHEPEELFEDKDPLETQDPITISIEELQIEI